MAKKLDKKKIVICQTHGFSNADTRTKVKGVAEAIASNIVDYPSVLPLPSAVLVTIAAGQTIADDRATMEIALAALVKAEGANSQALNDVVQDEWVGQVQTDAAGDVTKVTAVGMAYKGTGPGPDKTQFGTSHPIINIPKINKNVTAQLGFDMLNSATNKKAKPYGAVGYFALRQIGGEVPPTIANHVNMVAGTPHTDMDFIDVFLPAQIGMTVYYIFVWYDKDGNISPLSAVYSFVIPG